MSDRIFADTPSAIRWAEGFVARMHMKSQIGKLMSGPSGGEPMFDVALTISSRLAECEPRVAAVVVKAIYMPPDPDFDELVGQIIGEQIKSHKAAMNKTLRQINGLGTATLKAERAMRVYGDKYPIRRMAYDAGITHKNFIKGMTWIKLRAEATETIDQWHTMVMSEMGSFLDERGWLGE